MCQPAWKKPTVIEINVVPPPPPVRLFVADATWHLIPARSFRCGGPERRRLAVHVKGYRFMAKVSGS